MWEKVQTRVVIDIRAAKVKQPCHVVECIDDGSNELLALQFFPDRGEFTFMRLPWTRVVRTELAQLCHE